MSSGSSFQMLGPATGNDRLPNVVRRQNGTVKRLEEADLSMCRLGAPTTRVKYGMLMNADESSTEDRRLSRLSAVRLNG